MNYLLNKSIIENVKDVLINTKKNVATTSMDDYQNYARSNVFGRKYALQGVQRMYFQEEYEDKKADYYLQQGAKENVSQNLISMIEDHPEIQFDIFIPPYSILKWYNYYRTKEVIPYIGLYTYIAEQIIPYDNVSLFFYQGNTDVITNLDNYMDTMHPSEEVNRDIIDYMQVSDHKLTLDNYQVKFNDFRDFIESYDYQTLVDEAWNLPLE